MTRNLLVFVALVGALLADPATAQEIGDGHEVARSIRALVERCRFDDALAVKYSDTAAAGTNRLRYRGLPVAGAFLASAGDGDVWGWMFQAPPDKVAGALGVKERAMTVVRKAYGLKPVTVRLQLHEYDGRTQLRCFWKNPNRRD